MKEEKKYKFVYFYPFSFTDQSVILNVSRGPMHRHNMKLSLASLNGRFEKKNEAKSRSDNFDGKRREKKQTKH